MNETVLALVDAINSGDAIDTENAFAAAMAEKLSVKIDEYRQSVAASMFAQPEEVVEEETISEEEYNALSEEEKAEYEIIDEAMSLKDAQKSLKANYGQAHDTHGDFDTERKDQAAAKREFVKAKKVIKKQGGDYNKTKAQAVKKFERENSY